MLLALAGTVEDKISTLSWFLEELKKDLETLEVQEAPQEGPALKKPRIAPVIPELQNLVDTCIVRLRDHPGVLRVNYLPSRKAFKVHLKDGPGVMEFLAKGGLSSP